MSEAREKAALLSHADLCRIAGRFMRGRGYLSYLESGSIHCAERPDVIGWRGNGHSMVIECKRTRSDFRADRLKSHRQCEELGMGLLRYYLCPAGLLAPPEVPGKWGLLWAYESRVTVAKAAGAFQYTDCAVSEKKVLIALLARLDRDIRESAAGLLPALPGRYQ